MPTATLDKPKADNQIQRISGVERLKPLITIKADDSGNLPEEIELLTTGMWDAPYHGVFMITPQDLQQYVDNFHQDIRASSSTMGLPIDYEHDADGGAAGWIMDLRVGPASDPQNAANGGQSLWASVDWTPPGAEAVAGGVYKFISPEFCPEGYVDPEGQLEPMDNVLIGAGLTNRPLLKGLQPVAAHEDGNTSQVDKSGEIGLTNDKLFIKIKANQNKGERQVDLSQIRTKNAADLSDEEKQYLADHKTELSADEVAKFGLGEAATTPADNSQTQNTNVNEEEEEEVNNTATTQTQPVAASETGNVTITASELESLKASAAKGELAHKALERAEAEKHLNSLCFNEQNGVRVKPELRANVTEHYLSLSDEQRKAFDKIMEGVAPVADRLMFNSTGSGADPAEQSNSAYSQVKDKAEQLVKDGKVATFSEAVTSVLASDNALAASYEKEVYGGRITQVMRTAGARG